MCTYCTPQSCSRQKWVPEGLGISQPSPKDPQICLSQLCKSVGTHGKRQGWTDVGGQPLDTWNTDSRCQKTTLKMRFFCNTSDLKGEGGST